jgi:hypothetical protein
LWRVLARRVICDGNYLLRLGMEEASSTPMARRPYNQESADLRTQIDDLVNEYGGAARVAETLRSAPGFENFNRATVYRWTSTNGPRATIDVNKAMRAIEFLRSWKTERTLKIAVPATLQSLPVIMLTWPDVNKDDDSRKREAKKSSPYDFLKRYGVKLAPTPCSGGYEAINLLRSRPDLDLALAAREFGENVSPPIHRLCRIAKAPWFGVAKKQSVSLTDLKGKAVAYHPNTALRPKLDAIKKDLGIDVDRKPLENADEVVKLFEQHNDAIAIGWEPYLSEIKDKFWRLHDEHLFDIRFSSRDESDYAVEVDLFVRESADPTAVRFFLDALDKANKYIMEKASNEEIASLCLKKLPDWRLKKSMVVQALDEQTTKYLLDELEPNVIREFWKREVAAKKVSKTNEKS